MKHGQLKKGVVSPDLQHTTNSVSKPIAEHWKVSSKTCCSDILCTRLNAQMYSPAFEYHLCKLPSPVWIDSSFGTAGALQHGAAPSGVHTQETLEKKQQLQAITNRFAVSQTPAFIYLLLLKRTTHIWEEGKPTRIAYLNWLTGLKKQKQKTASRFSLAL